jgi:hypothetical protein
MAGDLPMEPVNNSLAGACFAPLLTFRRSAIALNTRITATTMLSRVLAMAQNKTFGGRRPVTSAE